MVNHTDWEVLTLAQKGSPMGDLLRCYWIPVLLTEDLQPGGSPQRVRILNEDLIAFRNSDGTPGLLSDRCAHRGASLYFARNEECGLRCVYHGWQYDATGQCVDMPNEPPKSRFKEKIKIAGYPCVDYGGMIWSYMGTGKPPELPAFEWAQVPPENRLITKRVQDTNWFQALEGGVDSSHISFLHAPLQTEYASDWPSWIQSSADFRLADRHPHFEVVRTDFGVKIAARRDAGPDNYYWRISNFFMPFFTMVPAGGEDPHYPGKFFVPMDDNHCVNWSVNWHPARALRESEIEELRRGDGAHYCDYLPARPDLPYGDIRCADNAKNNYDRDLKAQSERRYFGVKGVGLQDQSIQESQGEVADRTAEHLGSADLAVIEVRRLLREDAERVRQGSNDPTGLHHPDAYQVRGYGIVLPRSASWVDETDQLMAAEIGVGRSSV